MPEAGNVSVYAGRRRDMSDLISRQKVMWILTNLSYTQCKTQGEADVIETAKTLVITMPPAQPEPLTDKEQRIFLAAMRREEKVCEGADRMREPYEDSLVRVCKEIRRKVKGALWT